MKKEHDNNGEIELRVERIVANGYGIGFAEGVTVFVALATVGDRVRVRVTRRKKRVAFAEIVEVIEPSPDRVKPRCRHFGVCGGCDLQQMSYSAQLAAKAAIIRDALKHIAKIDLADDVEVAASRNDLGYRSRARWHADRPANKIGYYERGSHDIVDVAECPILVPSLESKIAELRGGLSEAWNDHFEIDAAEGDDGTISLYSQEFAEPAAELVHRTAAGNFRYSAAGFFQANKFLIDELTAAAIGDAEGKLAFDLYCGVGLFTVPLAQRFDRVIGVEENEEAVHFAKRNSADLTNIEIAAGRVAAFLAANAERPDHILLDPPRSGADKGVIEAIVRLRPRTIAYVSCEPSMLARDLVILCDGGYEIVRIKALDLFPQTHHIETVVQLSLKGRAP